MLTFPSPDAFLQSVRQRRRALDSSIPIVIVEGSSDKRALSAFLNPDAVTIPANGKDFLIHAYDFLEARLRRGVIFLLDCDGRVDQRFKGNIDLVLTSNRDMEADLVFELNAVRRLAHEFLAPAASSAGEIEGFVASITADACTLSGTIGLTRDAAKEHGLPVRIRDHVTGKKRKVGLLDLSEATRWAADIRIFGVGELTNALGGFLGWTREQMAFVSGRSATVANAPCIKHSVNTCWPCLRRSNCNGHDLVDALYLVLCARHRIDTRVEEVARALRMGIGPESLAAWTVARRISAWEAANECSVILL